MEEPDVPETALLSQQSLAHDWERPEEDEGDVEELKQPITMRVDKPTIAYFKSLAEELGMPYQSLINLYLRDCALHQKKLQLKWTS